MARAVADGNGGRRDRRAVGVARTGHGARRASARAAPGTDNVELFSRP